MSLLRIFIFLLLIPLFIMCKGSDGNRQVRQVNDDSLEMNLVNANRHVVETEDRQIRSLIERYKWEMTETGTGLRYMIYRNGKGEKSSVGKTAKINYEVRLISGDIIYTSAASGPKVFTIGKGGVESGLEEGILHLHVGDKAKLILPSHLAYGLIGDQDRIPPKSTIIYDIELLELK